MTVNNFLFLGGDGFTVLKDGQTPQFDALYAYFRDNSPVGPAPGNRILRMN